MICRLFIVAALLPVLLATAAMAETADPRMGDQQIYTATTVLCPTGSDDPTKCVEHYHNFMPLKRCEVDAPKMASMWLRHHSEWQLKSVTCEPEQKDNPE